MRIMLTTWGTDGDSRPTLALAQALAAAGHDPIVMADVSAKGLATALGIEFQPVPGSFHELMLGDSPMARSIKTGSSPLGTWKSLAQDFAPTAIRRLEELLPGVDALIGLGMGRMLTAPVARAHAIPFVGVDLQPFEPTRAFPPPILALEQVPRWANRPLYTVMDAMLWGIGKLVLERGLPKPPRRAAADDLTLGAWSPALLPRPHDWPKTKPVVTGEFRIQTDTLPPPQQVKDFLAAGDAPVFAGLGSMTGMDGVAFRTAVIDTLDGRRALLSAGWSDLDTRHLPANILPVGPIDHAWLFPQCRAVIHHAGAGTAHTAARAGVPSVCIPQVADQGFWARVLQRQGVAPAPLDRHNLTSAALRQALTETEGMQASARDLARRMARDDGTSQAVQLIQEHLRASTRSE